MRAQEELQGQKQKRGGDNLSAKHIKTPFFGREAMGNAVWSKCLSQAKRERI